MPKTVITEIQKRDFIFANIKLFEAVWAKGPRSDEAKQVEKYFKNNQIISFGYPRPDLIRRLLSTYSKMVEAKEVPPPAHPMLSLERSTYNLPTVQVNPSKTTLVQDNERANLSPRRFEKAYEFLQRTYFKRED